MTNTHNNQVMLIRCLIVVDYNTLLYVSQMKTCYNVLYINSVKLPNRVLG